MSPSSRLGVALGGLGTRAGPSRGLQLLGVGDRAPGGVLALVEALGVGAALRGVELQVGAAPPEAHRFAASSSALPIPSPRRSGWTARSSTQQRGPKRTECGSR